MGKNTTTLLLVVINLVLLFWVVTRKDEIITTSVPIVTIQYDSIPYEVIKKISYPVNIIDTVYIPLDVDTMAILADYFKIRIYNDTLINTADLRVIVQDSVHQNKLFGRRHTLYQNFRIDTVTVDCPTIPDNKLRWYLGVQANFRKNGIGPSVGLTDSKRLYTYSYDIVNNSHHVNIAWQIKLRRK